MRLRFIAVAAAVVATAATVGVSASPAEAGVLSKSYAMWGHSYGGQLVFGHNSAREFASPNETFRFAIQADHNLVTYLRAVSGTKYNLYPYWSSRTSKTGYSTVLQNDGNVVVRTSSGSVAWKSGRTQPLNRYNYLLTIQNDGNLVEYYSAGDPRNAAGRHVLWATNRRPGVVSQCASSQISPGGITEIKALMADGGTVNVKISNRNILPLVGDVYRWIGGRKADSRTFAIAPWKDKTFSHFYHGDNLPEIVTIRTSNSASSVVAGMSVSGHCWYRP